MLFFLCDVSTLDQAVERAKQAGACYVKFVPLTGEIQEAHFEPLDPAGMPGFATAFEGPEATSAQLIRIIESGEREGQNLGLRNQLARVPFLECPITGQWASARVAHAWKIVPPQGGWNYGDPPTEPHAP